ncbi:MAG: bifunctional 4-hydroxy-2-oxoglutarate aldolase/2-dehydro-3-deoxy-phosphogluconate aldolase [Spirochaetaceae bacterium]|jgi:2-dehydro-3-deoxyphosphogluconate aldolase/(4S)-4-hydroxy-2-oxoglutarate aldolase|nr:bifunctional 4-hydroxy-2-oxoglutarate aldolase/2-dehydro-3-deoxy-phosphogluconate aldolase [Spirochaetaceae bacterium]
MNDILFELEKTGIVPVIKIDDAANAVPLARALLEGGIPCAEITFRTEAGAAAIKNIAREVPQVIVGAGTVLTTEQVDKAIDAGAQFIVSPGFNPRVVKHCLDKKIPVTPGCTNPSDMEAALEMGLTAVKFFPAEQSGGLPYLKAVSAPFSMLKFMPTGGINAANLAAYLAFDKIIACGGSWMVPPEALNAGDFAKITALCREAVNTMLRFNLAHIGINTTNETEAKNAARQFELLFGFIPRETTGSIFAASYIELMKAPGLGKNGHIAIGTNSILRARAFLERKGFAFNEESKKLDADGKVMAIYFKDEIAGFAVHLVEQKLK